MNFLRLNFRLEVSVHVITSVIIFALRRSRRRYIDFCTWALLDCNGCSAKVKFREINFYVNLAFFDWVRRREDCIKQIFPNCAEVNVDILKVHRMATEKSEIAEKRVVLLAVDGSQNSERAFQCKFHVFQIWNEWEFNIKRYVIWV